MYRLENDVDKVVVIYSFPEHNMCKVEATFDPDLNGYVSFLLNISQFKILDYCPSVSFDLGNHSKKTLQYLLKILYDQSKCDKMEDKIREMLMIYFEI